MGIVPGRVRSKSGLHPKEVFNARPPKPKYAFTCDVQIVLHFVNIKVLEYLPNCKKDKLIS